MDKTRKEGSSTGGVIEIFANGIPPGLGEPIFDRLDADIAKAMMCIPAVKGVEVGSGFASAAFNGPENTDEIRVNKDGKPTTSDCVLDTDQSIRRTEEAQ